jgi:hypothetical protein
MSDEDRLRIPLIRSFKLSNNQIYQIVSKDVLGPARGL